MSGANGRDGGKEDRITSTRQCPIHPMGCSPYCFNWYGIHEEVKVGADAIEPDSTRSSRRSSASSVNSNGGSSNGGSSISGSMPSVCFSTPNAQTGVNDDLEEVAGSINSAEISPIMNMLKLSESMGTERGAVAVEQLKASACGSIAEVISPNGSILSQPTEDNNPPRRISSLGSVFNADNSSEDAENSGELFEFEM